MSRIAKKSRSVNRGKGQKKVKQPPRYTIRKDSLNRRYAIDKRTGKRVSVLKAEKERLKRKKTTTKAIEVFRRITPPKPPKKQPTRKKQLESARLGWKRHPIFIKPIIPQVISPIGPPLPSPPIVFEGRPPSFAELTGLFIPEGMKMHVVGGIADRAAKYPKVEKAADRAWINLQVEAFAQQRAIGAGEERPLIITPRFDRLYGKTHGSFIRFNYFAHAANLADIDQMVDTLEQDEDNDYVSRELYTLYFSPEVA